MLDVSVGHSDKQVRCKGNCHSLGEWRCLVSYQVAQSRRTRGHSDMTVGLVPTRSNVSASPFITVSRMCSRLDECKCRNISSLWAGCVPSSMRVFHHCEQDVVSTWMEEQRSSIIVSRMWFRPGWKCRNLPSLWAGCGSRLGEKNRVLSSLRADVVPAWMEV